MMTSSIVIANLRSTQKAIVEISTTYYLHCGHCHNEMAYVQHLLILQDV